MYLKHFGFSKFPFALSPNLHFFCALTTYQEALDTMLVSLQNGEGFIKITGEVGTGKTLLCQKLLTSLNQAYVAIYIANTTLDIFNLYKMIAHELGIPLLKDMDNHQLFTLLTKKLAALYQQGKRVVMVLDEAHAMTDIILESLRLLSNLETTTPTLLQIILVGQPELNRKLKQPHLRHLAQRIVFSYHVTNLQNKQELLAYLYYRLSAAGYQNRRHLLFTPQALKVLLKASRGIPRLVNVLCHKALLVAYSANEKIVRTKAIKMALADTKTIASSPLTASHLLKTTALPLLLATWMGLGGYSLTKLLFVIL